MKIVLFADRGQVTAISFPGEALNFNGVAVHSIECEADQVEAAIMAVAPSGVGSPWPAIEPKVTVAPKVTKAVSK